MTTFLKKEEVFDLTDTKLLKEKIENSGYRFNWIAKNLNLTPYGLRKKVNGETEFKATEIVKFQEILKISNTERDKIFCLICWKNDNILNLKKGDDIWKINRNKKYIGIKGGLWNKNQENIKDT